MDYGKLYDEHVADTYDADALGLLTGVRNLSLAQIKGSTLAPDATIVDLGAGTGLTLAALTGRFPQSRMIAIDLSARMLEVAKQRLPVEAHVDDVHNIEKHVAPASVDLALAHFLTTFVDRPRLFRATAATLRPDGLLSVVATTGEAFGGIRRNVDRLLGQGGLTKELSPAPDTAEALAAELRAAGFEIVAQEIFRKPVVFDNFDAGLKWGKESGFFTHIVEGLGMIKIGLLKMLTRGMFPFHDEYVGVAILARPVRA
jgi:SAM-dependent methyltransferase